MNKRLLLLPLLLWFPILLRAQVIIPRYLRIPLPDSALIVHGVDTLLAQIQAGRISTGLIAPPDTAFTKDVFSSFKELEDNSETHLTGFYKPQLLNCYPVAPHQYLVTWSYLGVGEDGAPLHRATVQVMANVLDSAVQFATPLEWNTRYWQTKRVGRANYHYPDKINVDRAKRFDANNTRIAKKLGLAPASLQFYLTANYQEILQILGYVYDANDNGRYRDGYGVVENNIFAVMHNEDFSHDLLHFYVWQIRTLPRNGPAEEGLA